MAKRCPHCGGMAGTVESAGAVVVHQCIAGIVIERLDVWERRPIEDELQQQIEELKSRPAHLADGHGRRALLRLGLKLLAALLAGAALWLLIVEPAL